MNGLRTGELLCAALLAGIIACGGGNRSTSRTSTSTTGTNRRAVRRALMTAAESAAARNLWNVPEVIRRLTDAGLVVTDSNITVHHAGLQVPGRELALGHHGTLEVYLYPDAAARRRAEASLDTTVHGLRTLETPYYIMSGNLIAILHTPDDRQADRVQNTLTAWHTSGGS